MIRICDSIVQLSSELKNIKFDYEIFRELRPCLKHSGDVAKVYIDESNYLKFIYIADNLECDDFGMRVEYSCKINLLNSKLSEYKNIDESALNLNNIDTYVFYELEEYSFAIAEYLIEEHKEKRVIFLDQNAKYFWPEIECYDSVLSLPDDIYRCLYIVSYHKDFFVPMPKGTLFISSIELLNSLIQFQKIKHFGTLNSDKTIFLIDMEFAENQGLGDVIKFINPLVIYAYEHGFYPVIDIHSPKQYLKCDNSNLWEYYFDPVSDITVDEAYQSENVISVKDNNFEIASVIWMHKFKNNMYLANEWVRLKSEMVSEFEYYWNSHFDDKNDILAVIARGTDLKDKRSYGISIENIADACSELLRQGSYSYIFFASEENDYFQFFSKKFSNKLLYIDQNRADESDGKTDQYVSYRLNIQNGSEWGRKYLLITYCLSKCDSILYNMNTGTYRLAKRWKENRGEKYKEEFDCVDRPAIRDFNSIIGRINQFYNDHNSVVIYGTGRRAEKLYFLISRYLEKTIFCDKKAEYGNVQFQGNDVISPKHLSNIYHQNEYGIIICVANDQKTIIQNLLDLGISLQDIMEPITESEMHLLY